MANLAHFWMPFSMNKRFKQDPKLFKASSGMYYTSDDGRQVLDATSGLWCTNAGNSRPEIAEAVARQLSTMSFSPAFQLGHSSAFLLAEKLASIAPKGMGQVFFTNSGSESVDSALKIALAYWRTKGQGHKVRLIGRERGYHGVGFGGISVGGMVNNRKFYGQSLPFVDHLPDTHHGYDVFCKGQPEVSGEVLKGHAEALLRLIQLNSADNIAAVIVEPVAGSTGVLIPPKGYLQQLRDICTQHNILLIFDEVITGYGRVGDAFASNHWGVTPDLMTTAKGLTNGAVPMGAVFVKDEIYQHFIDNSPNGIDLFHGYTYSAHPVACAAALATLEIYAKENLFETAKTLATYWQDSLLKLKSLEHVTSVRSYGLMAGIDIRSRDKAVGERAYAIFTHAFAKEGVLVRASGDSIAMSPPLITEKTHIDEAIEKLTRAIQAVD